MGRGMWTTQSDLLDTYNNYSYIIPTRLASHQSPYVKVRHNDYQASVAYILLKTGEVHFYDQTPRKIRQDQGVIEEWYEKNSDLCNVRWNQNNGEKYGFIDR